MALRDVPKQGTDLKSSDQLLDIYSMLQLYYRSCWNQSSWNACCCYCLHSGILTFQTSSLAYDSLTKPSLITDLGPSGLLGYTKNVVITTYNSNNDRVHTLKHSDPGPLLALNDSVREAIIPCDINRGGSSSHSKNPQLALRQDQNFLPLLADSLTTVIKMPSSLHLHFRAGLSEITSCVWVDL